MTVTKDRGLFALDHLAVTLWLLMLSCSPRFSTLPRFPFLQPQVPTGLSAVQSVPSACWLLGQSSLLICTGSEVANGGFFLGLWNAINVLHGDYRLRLLATFLLHHHWHLPVVKIQRLTYWEWVWVERFGWTISFLAHYKPKTAKPPRSPRIRKVSNMACSESQLCNSTAHLGGK